jgi:hypothetical protein
MSIKSISKSLIYGLLLSILIVGAAKTSFADEITGTVVKIENKRVTVESTNGKVTVVINNTEGIKVGDHIKVVCHPVGDRTDIFIADEIKPSN